MGSISDQCKLAYFVDDIILISLNGYNKDNSADNSEI
jgi:hypothetical protein